MLAGGGGGGGSFSHAERWGGGLLNMSFVLLKLGPVRKICDEFHLIAFGSYLPMSVKFNDENHF